MERINIKNKGHIKGELIPPPDKSISHRAVMFASIAEGRSIIRNCLMAEDPISTMNAMRMMGVEIELAEEEVKKVRSLEDKRVSTSHLLNFTTSIIINGKGLYGLKEPFDVINCGNSGTTIRLISGILAGNSFFSVLTGDDSLKQRPMARVIKPLREMGAEISARDNDRYLPMAIKGGNLKAIDYSMPVASAQVKSCLTLAGLYADGTTTITEPYKSRDHTERILKAMGADIEVEGLTIRVKGQGSRVKELSPIDITAPADFSSAAFFIVAALIVPDSEILIKGVGINPTRTGLLNVIKDMGGVVKLENIRDVSGEPVADIYCKTTDNLRAVKIGKEIMPSLIDEFPILCVLATQAEGITEIRGAEELRVKESDRIASMAGELKKFGVEIDELEDGLIVKGRGKLKGATVQSHGDHRVAMSMAIAGLVADGETTIEDTACVNTSYPGFMETLDKLRSEK
ncbi:MAG: 3-phosphoshikimate 1-carboxyvinyltransferase [Nitrospirae bacterium]|nr:3-phosphoshikimate 1-carboxyvinyltransferase [Nitrospirota bacterium]